MWQPLCVVLLAIDLCLGADYWVSTGGSTSGTGSRERPWPTVTFASGKVAAGDTVHVMPGTYSGRVGTGASGSGPNGRIVFKSEVKWGAKLVGGTDIYNWVNTGSYVDIVGFDVTGSRIQYALLSLAHGVRFIGNHVHNIPGGGTAKDGAAIQIGGYTNGYTFKNNDLIGNVIHDVGPLASGKNSQTHGLYHACPGGKIWNNIVYRTVGWGIHTWHNPKDLSIMNNLVFGNLAGGILTGCGDDPGTGRTGGFVVANNIVMLNSGWGFQEMGVQTGTNNTYVNNLCFDNKNGCIQLYDFHKQRDTITRADPMFVNWKADGTGDYHLRAGSPCIDAGMSIQVPTYDFDNNLRPKGRTYDIGPFEYSSSTPPPPPPPPPPTESSSSAPSGDTTKVVGLQDTRLLKHLPTTSFASKDFIDVGRDPSEGSNAVYRSLLRFTEPTGLGGSNVASATLSLNWFFPEAARQADTVIDVFSPSASWNVATATWTNRVDSTAWATAGGNWVDAKGVSMGSTPFATTVISRGTAATSTFINLDVTSMVAKIAAGTLANNGFLVKARDETVANYVAFHSAEAAEAAKRPKLAITMSSFAPITATGLLDTRMLRHTPTIPYPTKAFLDIGGTTLASTWRSLIKFNIARSSTYTAKSAMLSLFWFYSDVRTADTIIEVYRPATTWDVKTTTWNVRQTGSPWGLAGGEWYDRNGVKQGTAPFASVVITRGAPVKNGYINLQVASLVSKYISGAYPNTGFLIKARTEQGNYIAFHSAEATNPNTRPKLVILPGLRTGANVDGSSVVLPTFLIALVGIALACL